MNKYFLLNMTLKKFGTWYEYNLHGGNNGIAFLLLKNNPGGENTIW